MEVPEPPEFEPISFEVNPDAYSSPTECVFHELLDLVAGKGMKGEQALHLRLPTRKTQCDTPAQPEAAKSAEPVSDDGASATSGQSNGIRPLALSRPRPAYPASARRKRWQGVVLLSLRVGVNGKVEAVGVETSSGHDVLDDAAAKALARWEFTPAQKDGRAVEETVKVRVVFKLEK
jgi:protein TonB